MGLPIFGQMYDTYDKKCAPGYELRQGPGHNTPGGYYCQWVGEQPTPIEEELIEITQKSGYLGSTTAQWGSQEAYNQALTETNSSIDAFNEKLKSIPEEAKKNPGLTVILWVLGALVLIYLAFRNR